MPVDFHTSSNLHPVGKEKRANKTNATTAAVVANSVSATKTDSCQVTDYSIDPRGVSSTIKPVNVGLVKTLLRVCDVFASLFPTTTVGEKITFAQLTQQQKVKVFNATASVPGIKIEQIRVYHNFAMYCWKIILEMETNSPALESRVTIKQFILDQCTVHFKIQSNVGNVNVTQLLQVCFTFAFFFYAPNYIFTSSNSHHFFFL